MPNVYLSNRTKRKLTEFIQKSRISPQFGAKNKYPSPNKAIEFLLEIGLKFPLEALERLLKQPFVQFSMRMSDEEFAKIEESGELKKIIAKKFAKAEEESENDET